MLIFIFLDSKQKILHRMSSYCKWQRMPRGLGAGGEEVQLGIGWRSVVSFTFRPPYRRELSARWSLNRRLCGPVWMFRSKACKAVTIPTRGQTRRHLKIHCVRRRHALPYWVSTNSRCHRAHIYPVCVCVYVCACVSVIAIRLSWFLG